MNDEVVLQQVLQSYSKSTQLHLLSPYGKAYSHTTRENPSTTSGFPIY